MFEYSKEVGILVGSYKMVGNRKRHHDKCAEFPVGAYDVLRKMQNVDVIVWIYWVLNVITRICSNIACCDLLFLLQVGFKSANMLGLALGFSSHYEMKCNVTKHFYFNSHIPTVLQRMSLRTKQLKSPILNANKHSISYKSFQTICLVCDGH